MKKKNDNISRRERNATLGLVLCFVAMIAVAGAVSFRQSKQRARLQEQQRLAEAEANETKESQSANTDSIQAELETPIEEEPIVEEPIVEDVPVVPQAPTLYFSANDELLWPVDGNVLLSYSMDQTVYFSTLEQYKYNPALIISGEVGEQVIAAADGEITFIETSAETGTTITMSLGSGYELICGQLKEVCVQEGDRVSQGDLLGYVSEPTKYYSVEGPNVYFQLLNDGVPVNPLEYLAE